MSVFKQVVATINNPGRGGLAPFGRIARLADHIHHAQYSQDSVILVSATEKGTGEDMRQTLLAMLDAVKPDKDGKLPSYKIGEKSYKHADIVGAVTLADYGNNLAPVAVVGNSRTTSLALLHALGLPIPKSVPCVVVKGDALEVAIQSNKNNDLVIKLDWVQKLNTVITLHTEGKVQIQSDLRKRFEEGTGQHLWCMLQGVVHAGLSIEQAASLRSDPTTRAAILKPVKQAKTELLAWLAAQEDKTTRNKQKAISGPKILEMAGKFPDFAELLNAIGNGQVVVAEQFMRCHAINELVPDGAESLS